MIRKGDFLPRKLTPDEKFNRKCKKDKEIKWGIKCKYCNRYYEVTEYPIEIHCSCGKVVFTNYKPYRRNCKVLYKGKGKK